MAFLFTGVQSASRYKEIIGQIELLSKYAYFSMCLTVTICIFSQLFFEIYRCLKAHFFRPLIVQGFHPIGKLHSDIWQLMSVNVVESLLLLLVRSHSFRICPLHNVGVSSSSQKKSRRIQMHSIFTPNCYRIIMLNRQYAFVKCYKFIRMRNSKSRKNIL